MDTLFFVLVVVAHDVGSAGRVREENPEARGAAKTLAYFLSPLKCSRSLGDLFVFNEGKLGEHLDLFNNSVVGH